MHTQKILLLLRLVTIKLRKIKNIKEERDIFLTSRQVMSQQIYLILMLRVTNLKILTKQRLPRTNK